MSGPLYAGAASPESLTVKVGEGCTAVPVDVLDLTTVTAVVFRVLRADGTTVDWAASIVAGATPTVLDATYTFSANGLDLPNTGDLFISVRLTVPGGVVRCAPFRQPVFDQFQVQISGP